MKFFSRQLKLLACLATSISAVALSRCRSHRHHEGVARSLRLASSGIRHRARRRRATADRVRRTGPPPCRRHLAPQFRAVARATPKAATPAPGMADDGRRKLPSTTKRCRLHFLILRWRDDAIASHHRGNPLRLRCNVRKSDKALRAGSDNQSANRWLHAAGPPSRLLSILRDRRRLRSFSTLLVPR